MRYIYPLPKCLYCEKEISRPHALTCGAPECKARRKREYNLYAGRRRKAERAEQDPLPKCLYCEKPVWRYGSSTCGSDECRKKLRSEQNKRYTTEAKKRVRHVAPLPKCRYCDRQVIRRGAVTCGLRSCKQKNQTLVQQAYRATRDYETSKNGFTLDEVRRYFGMKPLTKTKIRCKLCGKWFASENTTTIRHCNDCRVQMKRLESGSVKTCNFYEKKNRAVSGA